MRDGRRLDRVVVVGRRDESAQDRLRGAFAPARVDFHGDLPDAATLQGPVDALVLPGDAAAELAAIPGLGWIHCDKAGVEGTATQALLDEGIRISCSAGRSAPALAEHALLFMLALAFRLPDHLRAQRWRHWGLPAEVVAQRRPLVGATTTIVGVGATGTVLARRCAALGMAVRGYRRNDRPADPAFERVHAAHRGERLLDLLPDTDFLVLAAGLNDDTHHLVAAEQLRAMPTGSYLINVARGGLVDESALVAALRSGHLAGAGLDVAAVEPLPPTSRLWGAPNLLLTPHSTPRMVDRDDRAIDIIADNAERYRTGEPLRNEVGPADIYSREPARLAGSTAARLVGGGWRRTVRALWSTSR